MLKNQCLKTLLSLIKKPQRGVEAEVVGAEGFEPPTPSV